MSARRRLRSARIVTIVTHAGATLRPLGEFGFPRLRGGLRRDRRAGGEQAAQEAIDRAITLLGARRKEIVLVTKIGPSGDATT